MAKNIMSWDKAILKVLEEQKRAMFYYEIADEIIKQELRPSEHLGATPANTVNSYLRNALKDKVQPTQKRGEYELINSIQPCLSVQNNSDEDDNDLEEALITAFGRFWDRELFVKNNYELYGASLRFAGAESVNFSKHAGIYLLHKGHTVVYVGQASNLIDRLTKHTKDDLRNRWDSFSWFSIQTINDDEADSKDAKTKNKYVNRKQILDTLEALLIEVLGPERNKQAGRGFIYKEYEQIEEIDFMKRQYDKKQ